MMRKKKLNIFIMEVAYITILLLIFMCIHIFCSVDTQVIFCLFVFIGMLFSLRGSIIEWERLISNFEDTSNNNTERRMEVKANMIRDVISGVIFLIFALLLKGVN